MFAFETACKCVLSKMDAHVRHQNSVQALAARLKRMKGPGKSNLPLLTIYLIYLALKNIIAREMFIDEKVFSIHQSDCHFFLISIFFSLYLFGWI